MAAALDKANKEAGYDIPLAFAALNAITIQGQTEQRMPLFESRCDLTAAVDVVMRASGSTLTDDGLAMLLNFAVAYGYHYAKMVMGLTDVAEHVKQEVSGFDDMSDEELRAERDRLLAQARGDGDC